MSVPVVIAIAYALLGVAFFGTLACTALTMFYGEFLLSVGILTIGGLCFLAAAFGCSNFDVPKQALLMISVGLFAVAAVVVVVGVGNMMYNISRRVEV